MARPPKYKPIFVETAKAMAFAGGTDREVAEFLGVAERTIHRWKLEYPDFGHALAAGKQAADRRVEMALYRKATGYSFDSEKIWHWEGAVVRTPCVEHVPPSDTAAIFWLKNRQPEQYRERTEVDVSVTDNLADRIAAARRRVAEERDRRREATSSPPPLGPEQG